MTNFGKTIKLFLIEGEPTGRMTCELSNWTGKAYKIPRIRVKDCGDRPDLKNPGVYLLFGKTETGKDMVYIGEGESVLDSLMTHLAKKDFWNETIAFVSKDDNLNKAHIKYLENRLYSIATEKGRYAVDNENTPTQSSISESDRAEMEEFIEHIKILVNTLGHKVFEEIREIKSEQRQELETFFAKGVRGALGQGESTTDGFLVTKGSKVADPIAPSLTPNFVKIRETLLSDGTIIKVANKLEFADDFLFSSPSGAASIIMGRNANGLIEWKLASGITLKDFELGNALELVASESSKAKKKRTDQ
jgi:hypothetical protein